jgi:hypothetical protein
MRSGRRLRWFDIDREQKIRKGWQAWDRRGITFDQSEPGYKYQPTDIDASIGLAALEDFDRNLEHRRGLVRVYRQRLSGMRCVSLLERGEADADWLFMVLVNADRDAFADWLRERGIETNVAHVRNDLFSVFGAAEEASGMDSVGGVPVPAAELEGRPRGRPRSATISAYESASLVDITITTYNRSTCSSARWRRSSRPWTCRIGSS